MKKFFLFVFFLVLLATSSFAVIYDPVNSLISKDEFLYVPDISQIAGVSPNIKVYNTNSGAPVLAATISPESLSAAPKGLALTPDGKTLYVSVVSGSNIYVKIFDCTN